MLLLSWLLDFPNSVIRRVHDIQVKFKCYRVIPAMKLVDLSILKVTKYYYRQQQAKTILFTNQKSDP